MLASPEHAQLTSCRYTEQLFARAAGRWRQHNPILGAGEQCGGRNNAWLLAAACPRTLRVAGLCLDI